ncbi:unnamed protein product [Caenorhabditis angaria]|uniref:Uncharacterized protein n=1 Tax=Caenorhabditis angaria TaxID=860376 RepID=A0A9P1ITS0_9PELO|nr:unnamed protein product [Caenorhabditis angaria]
MATIKKEISSPRKEVQKKRVEDDDESDDDRSVITLSSDSEIEEGKSKEDEEPMECGTDSSGEEEDEDESDESESDEEDEEETDSDEMTDSDSVWSTVDENGETEMITSEAIEAKIIRKFEKSMILLADKQIEKAKSFLLALLKKPLISIHRKSNIDFEEIEEISRPSKILQVYVAIHKNLAKLEPNKAIEHYLQVLYYTPNDTSIWLEVALKSFENGDLQFALYCFKKCENLKESTEAHATVLYLTCNYSGCLYLLKDYIEDVGELNDKMKYLKFKIRSTSNHYRKMCDNIFEEDDFYKEVKSLDSRRIAVFDQRFEEMSRKIREKQQLLDVSFNEEKELKPIQVEISEKQNLTDVFTIFCDLFDRIQAYSKLNYHPIEFKYWGNRKDYLEIEECLNEIVDIVDCVEDMTGKIGTKKSNKKAKEKYLSTWKTRLFVEEEVVEICETEDESDENRTESRENSPKNDFGLEENELAIEYGLKCENIRPISRTSSDFKYLDDENLLNSLRSHFLSQSQNLTITEIIKISLLKFSNYSGVLKNDLKVVVEEMYTRLAYYQFMATPKYDQINIIMMECDHRKGLELCLKKYISFFGYEQDDEEDDDDLINVKNMSENELYLRFCWKYSNTNLLDSIKLEYLYVLMNNMDEHRVISTSIDQFDLNDVKDKIEIIEKKLRIESIKQLWNSKNYQELIRICENDIDFSETGIEETEQILVFWLKSLEKSKKEESFVILATRVLHFYLFSESNSIENYEESIDILLKSLRKN